MAALFENGVFSYQNQTYTCEGLFYKIAEQGKGKFKKKRETIVSHVKRVAAMSGEMADKLGLGKECRDWLQNATWLHDTGKSLKDEKKQRAHHLPDNVGRAVAKALEENKSNRKAVRVALADNSDFCVLTRIINAHKPGEPLSRTELWESAILRMCDKIDKYFKISEKEADEKYLENLTDVVNQLEEAGIEKAQIQRFTTVCEEMRARAKQSASQQG